MQITYSRPLRLTIWQSGWRCFALRNELSTCIIYSFRINKTAEALAETRGAAFIVEGLLFAGVIRMRFGGDIERYVGIRLAFQLNFALGTDR